MFESLVLRPAILCVAVVSALLLACQSDPKESLVQETLVEQLVKRSSSGVLETELTASAGSADVGGRTVTGLQLYNGAFPSETWRVKPGDRIKVRLNNHLAKVTNLHFHGFHTSPGGNSDNVFLAINPGDSFEYDVAIPADHSSGLFWYHPHSHGVTDEQVYGGLAGLIVIEGEHDQQAGVKPLKQRVLSLQTLMVDGENALLADGASTTLQTVNGQLKPIVTAAPGETQFFRVGNVSNIGWVLLQVSGHKLNVVAEDGISYPAPEAVDEFLLAPGKRVEFLVQFKEKGTYALRNGGYKWGQASFATTPADDLASIVVQGAAVQSSALLSALANDHLADSELLTLPVARTRQLTFTEDFSGPDPLFLINGNVFDHHRVDVQAKLGEVEEWELINRSDEDHPFHIHINDFAVTKVNGVAVAVPRHQDVAKIPAGGSITIRQQYTEFPGKFVFHCHILFHEDHGMMGVVEIKP